MSHDFPDGPDYNPEPIDDDPWDAPEAHPDTCPWCGWPRHTASKTCGGIAWGEKDPPGATESPQSDDDS